VDPEPGKPSPWHQGVVREQQVLICPDCYSAVAGDLTHCPRCGSARLIKRLGQVECLECRATRDADAGPAVTTSPCSADSDLSAEVARALERILGSR
jgi:ribosomal protein L40E